MEPIMQNRRESSAHRVYHNENRHHEQRDRFFQHERLCQYVPCLDQTERSFLSSDACRQLISQLIWPRLVVIRVKSVLAALMPLMNLTDDGTFGVCLHGVSSTSIRLTTGRGRRRFSRCLHGRHWCECCNPCGRI